MHFLGFDLSSNKAVHVPASTGLLGFLLGYGICMLRHRRRRLQQQQQQQQQHKLPSSSSSSSTSLDASSITCAKSSSISSSLPFSSTFSSTHGLVGVPIESMTEEYGSCIYLDYNATTPIYPEVAEKIREHLGVFGNPSSPHVFARRAKEAIDHARVALKEVINCSSVNEVYFTSCGSEADNRAIDIALHHFRQHSSISSVDGSTPQGSQIVLSNQVYLLDNKNSSNAGSSDHLQRLLPCVITSAIEHPAVLCYLYALSANKKIKLIVLPVSKHGLLDPNAVETALASNWESVALVTVMHSNNEIGTIQPIRAIAAKIREHNKRFEGNSRVSSVLFHTDAAQSIAKVPVDVLSLGVDLLTIVGHKVGAPKGVAALYIKSGVKVMPMLVGGGQERGSRAGTENTLLIAAFGEACRVYLREARFLLVHLLQLKQRLVHALQNDPKIKAAEKRLIDAGKLGVGRPFVRFNGPSRACDAVELMKDVDMLRMINKLNGFKSQGDDTSSSSGSSNNINSSSNSISNSSNNSNGSGDPTSLDQLPNTISVSFCYMPAHKIIDRLKDQVALSAGSACHAKEAGHKPSAVLVAILLEEEYALGTLRISVGRHSTQQDVDRGCNLIADTLSILVDEFIRGDN